MDFYNKLLIDLSKFYSMFWCKRDEIQIFKWRMETMFVFTIENSTYTVKGG